jgi:hypothetical protein
MPEGGPEEAIEADYRRPRPMAFEYGDLLSEREDLRCGIAVTAQEHADCCQDREQEFEHDSPMLHHITSCRWNQPTAPDRNLLILKHDAVLANPQDTGVVSGKPHGRRLGPAKMATAFAPYSSHALALGARPGRWTHPRNSLDSQWCCLYYFLIVP